MPRTMPISRSKKCKDARSGVALIVAVIFLVLLVGSVYTIAARVSAVKRRQQYLIDYQKARYACDSAVKYALAGLEEQSFNLIEREDSPDFSDIYRLSQDEYKQYIADWFEWTRAKQPKDIKQAAGENTSEGKDKAVPGKGKNKTSDQPADANDMKGTDPNVSSGDDIAAALADLLSGTELEDANEITIPGPYGAEWPYVAEPVDFEIGSAKITIKIEDENAKFPLALAVTKDPKVTREVQAGVGTFCRQMQMSDDEIAGFLDQLEQISAQKQFDPNPKPVVIKTVPQPASPGPKDRREAKSRPGSKAAVSPPAPAAVPASSQTTRPVEANKTDFARLLHSSLINLETLTRALPGTGQRYEAAVKYLGLWGSDKVNINTAPRHVLEAIFMFGGQEAEIAEAIIEVRRKKPFGNIDDVENLLYKYLDSIRKTKPYLTTASSFLTVRVTATSGTAKVSTTVAVIKNGKSISKVAVLSY